MEPKATPRESASARRYLGGVWLGIALIVFWYLAGPGLRGPAADALLTRPVSAVCFILLGLAGWMRSRAIGRQPPWTALVAAYLVATVALLSMTVLAAQHFGFASLSGPSAPQLQTTPLTAVGLIAATVAVSTRKTEREIHLAQAAALVTSALGLATIMAYLYGSPLPTGIRRGVVDASFPAGVALTLFGFAALLDEPNRGFLRHLTGNLPTQEATRRLAIATVTIPILVGWIGVLLIRSRTTSPSLGVAFVVTSTFLVWGGLVWWTGKKLTEIQVRELSLQDQLKASVRERTAELEVALRDLEAFNHSVSHDLRAPARNMRFAAQTLRDDFAKRVPKSGRQLIDDMDRHAQDLQEKLAALSQLAKAGQAGLHRVPVPASELATEIMQRLRASEPNRRADLQIQPEVVVMADRVLFSILMENLLGNAWKFTRNVSPAIIEFGVEEGSAERGYFVRDNGVGFEAEQAASLFRPFRRLHPGFEGMGIGLTTVARIVRRHGGQIEAIGVPGRGAAFRFTMGAEDNRGTGPQHSSEPQPVATTPDPAAKPDAQPA